MTQCPSTFRFPCIRAESGEAGLTAEELASVLTPFLPSASSDFLIANKSAQQAFTTAPTTIVWENVSDSGGNITFADPQITLVAGNTYLLLLQLRCLFSTGGNSSCNYEFFDVTNAESIVGIVTSGQGARSVARPITGTANVSAPGIAIAVVTPSTEIVVEAIVPNETNITAVEVSGTWMYAQQIA